METVSATGSLDSRTVHCSVEARGVVVIEVGRRVGAVDTEALVGSQGTAVVPGLAATRAAVTKLAVAVVAAPSMGAVAVVREPGVTLSPGRPQILPTEKRRE